MFFKYASILVSALLLACISLLAYRAYLYWHQNISIQGALSHAIESSKSFNSGAGYLAFQGPPVNEAILTAAVFIVWAIFTALYYLSRR